MRPRFVAAVAAGPYAGFLGELVRRAKYGRDPLLAVPLRGLLLEAVITTAAVCFLVWAPRIAPRVRLALLALLVVLPAWATVNNLEVMRAVGIAVG